MNLSQQSLKGKWRKVLKGIPTKYDVMVFQREIEALSNHNKRKTTSST